MYKILDYTENGAPILRARDVLVPLYDLQQTIVFKNQDYKDDTEGEIVGIRTDYAIIDAEGTIEERVEYCVAVRDGKEFAYIAETDITEFVPVDYSEAE